MSLDRAALEAYVAKLNAARKADEQVKVEDHAEREFVLSYPDRPMPEGACIDSDFTEIQFALFEQKQLTTSIVSGERRDDGRYWMRYEIVVWD